VLATGVWSDFGRGGGGIVRDGGVCRGLVGVCIVRGWGVCREWVTLQRVGGLCRGGGGLQVVGVVCRARSGVCSGLVVGLQGVGGDIMQGVGGLGVVAVRRVWEEILCRGWGV